MEYDIEGLRVFIAIPVNRDFPWQTTKGLVDTAALLSSRGIPYTMQFLTQGSQIDFNRSHLTHQFLESDCNRIFWIDSDMGWDAHSFIRVLALSTKLDIVGASYPAKQSPGRQFQIDIGVEEVEANEHGCLEIRGMGLGFCCVQRHVMENLASKSRKYIRDGIVEAMVFRTGIGDDGVYRSEDMHFFRDCRAAGYKVWIDPTIELGHIGGFEYKGKLIDALVKRNDKESVSSFKADFTFPDDVEGWLTEGEGLLLANSARDKDVLEIGAFKGRSTICMAQTAREVTVVDPFDARNTPKPGSTLREFSENICRYGVEKKINTLVRLSGSFRTVCRFDLVFVDGDHEYEAVKKDIEWSIAHLKPGGLLAFHDYRSNTEYEGTHDGVDRAVDEFVRDGAVILRRVDSLILVKPPVSTTAA